MSDAEEVPVRTMRASDLARVMEIERGLKEAPHWTREAWQAVLDPGAARRRIAVVAADPESRTVQGFAVAAVAAPEAELESIAVAADWQRRGRARQMFDALKPMFWQAGVKEVFLEVRASNRAALGCYRTLGFEETGRRTGYYADRGEDAVLMRLRLG